MDMKKNLNKASPKKIIFIEIIIPVILFYFFHFGGTANAAPYSWVTQYINESRAIPQENLACASLNIGIKRITTQIL